MVHEFPGWAGAQVQLTAAGTRRDTRLS